MKMNKKALMEDLFDYLFTVIVIFLTLAIIGVIFSVGISARQEVIKENVDLTFENREGVLSIARNEFENGQEIDVSEVEMRMYDYDEYDGS